MAWEAKWAQIESLVDSGQCKTDLAKRVAVIKDTTVFKEWELESPNSSERRKRPYRLLLKHCLEVLFRRFAESVSEGVLHLNLERPMCLVLECAGISTGRHPHQLYLAEYVALKARDVLFHFDMVIDARNTVVLQAKKLANCIVEDVEESEGECSQMEFEDVGGAWHDDGEQDADGGLEIREGTIAEKISDWNVIEKFLC